MSCPACEPGACRTDTAPVYADCNSPGGGLVKYVPELAALERMEPGDMSRYVRANTPRTPDEFALRQALCEHEGVPDENLLIGGSGLTLLTMMPRAFGASDIVSVDGDFAGYAITAMTSGLRHYFVKDRPGNDLCQNLVQTVKALKCPIVFLTCPMSNPGMNRLNLDLVQAVLDAHPHAFVVVDAAYRLPALVQTGQIEPYAEYAANTDRVIYLNVAAKEYGACGARVSWLVGTTEMLGWIEPWIGPYPISLPAARYVTELARRPMLALQVHAVLAEATEILSDQISHLGLEVRSSPMPWVLIKIGEQLAEISEELRDRFDIHWQDQSLVTPSLAGWARVSSTVPCEARRICSALAQLKQEGTLRV